MNDVNSLIELHRKKVCETINASKYTKKIGGVKTTLDVLPEWETAMKRHIGLTPTMSSKDHAEKIFCLGEHLRDIFYSTKDPSSDRAQGELSSGGYLWERLVTYYLNYCLANTRTIVFIGATPFDAIKTAVTFNDMDSTSEVDLLAVTFPDKHEFTDDINTIRANYLATYPNKTTTPSELECIHNSRIGQATFIERFGNYLVADNYADIEIHVIQCKTNWNDIIQMPMLWSLVYYLSRDNVTLPTGANIKFGSGLYTLPRLKNFSYSFISVPTQNNGEYETDPTVAAKKKADFDNEFSETRLPVKRAKMIRGGYYWGLPKYNSIYPISEILNTNLNTGYSGHVVDNIKANIDGGKYTKEFNYFCNI